MDDEMTSLATGVYNPLADEDFHSNSDYRLRATKGVKRALDFPTASPPKKPAERSCKRPRQTKESEVEIIDVVLCPSPPSPLSMEELYSPSLSTSTTSLSSSTTDYESLDLLITSLAQTVTGTSCKKEFEEKHSNSNSNVDKTNANDPIGKTDVPAEAVTTNIDSEKGTGIFNLPLAPTLYPTKEEFANPWAYLLSKREEISKYGICVIQAPEDSEWDFDSFEKCVNPKLFSFETKAQNVHQMLNRSSPTVRFLHSLKGFLNKQKNNSANLYALPEVGGIPVDLRRLCKEIVKREGIDNIYASKTWSAVISSLHLPLPEEEAEEDLECKSNTQSNTHTNKEAEAEEDGSSTDLSDELHTLSSMAKALSNIYNTYLRDFVLSEDYKRLLEEEKRKAEEKAKKERDADKVLLSRKRKLQGDNDTQSNNDRPVKKRKIVQPDDVDGRGLSKGVSRVTRYSTEPFWRQVKSRSFVIDAEQVMANKEEEEEDMCDVTSFGYGKGRTFSLNEFQEMANNFEERWTGKSGTRGRVREKEEPVPVEKGARGRGRRVRGRTTRGRVEEGRGLRDSRGKKGVEASARCEQPVELSVEEKERLYWKIVQGGKQWVNVQYGSDLDVAQHGSGFPLDKDSKNISIRQRARAWELQKKKWRLPSCSSYMSKSGWNTNNLPEATFLHHLGENVGGVTRPMLYVGMLFSSFCWHTEDNYLYSVNYLHMGKSNLWYGVPSSAAAAFEDVMRQHLPHLFEQVPNLLHLLVTQMPPSFLVEAGVPVYTALQKKGQFVVTCPEAYHAGFNLGFNCAESVNFALEDWLPFGRKACDDYRYMRSAVFPHEEFILKALMRPDSPTVLALLLKELSTIIDTEERLQASLRNVGITRVGRDETQPPPITPFSPSKRKQSSDYHTCEECGFDCFLSFVVCDNHPGNVACLLHHDKLCSCGSEHKWLSSRVDLQSLKNLLGSFQTPTDATPTALETETQ